MTETAWTDPDFQFEVTGSRLVRRFSTSVTPGSAKPNPPRLFRAGKGLGWLGIWWMP